MRCLAKQPADRYPTAADVADDLRAGEVQRRGKLARRLTTALVTALMLALICVAVSRWPRAPLSPTSLPLLGTIDLMVWDPHDLDRQGVRIVETGAIPLQGGDCLRVSVQLNQPGYIYLLWLDTQGATLPVFPWADGRWDRRPGTEQARMVLALPREQGAGWVMRATHDGIETILLLVRHSPLPPEIDLPQLLSEVSPLALPPRCSVAWFQDGQPLAVADAFASSLDRHPVLNNVVGIPDPLLQMQRRVAELLRPHFELIRAVSFPVAGENPSVNASQPSS
jgi:hypothetical protein